jgi:hypothetical protein
MTSYLYIFLFQLTLISQICITEANAQSTIGSIPLPSNNYLRIKVEPASFGEWLRDLPLKEKSSPVLDYRGNIFKSGADSIVAGVINWDIKNRRLEQCMDILIRLYAEYSWENNNTASLSLPLPGGYWLSWEEWKSGFRPVFKGINVKLKKKTVSDGTLKIFRSYLKNIYNASHTQQFYHAYQAIDRNKVQIGDFIVKKGTKGHAIMIVDLAKNEHGDLIALIGNGDTPACQFFLLNFRTGQPWIPLVFTEDILDLPLRRKMSWDGLRRFVLPRK